MDYFLNMKNKSYEAQYYDSIDPYLSKIVRSNIITVVVVVPFVAYAYYVHVKDVPMTTETAVRRGVLGSFMYVLLMLLVIFIYKKWDFLRRHKKAARWSLDIFYNFVAGYFAYQFYDYSAPLSSPLTQLIYGWFNCFLISAVFSAISRWYLKISAFLIIILRIGIGVYIDSQSDMLFQKMFQMAALKSLLIYFHEKDRRKYFIEKQRLYEETKVYKEIFDLTSDGVIIYGLKEGMLFRNWSNEKHRWWDSDENTERNFEKIIMKEYKKVSQLPPDMVKHPLIILTYQFSFYRKGDRFKFACSVIQPDEFLRFY